MVARSPRAKARSTGSHGAASNRRSCSRWSTCSSVISTASRSRWIVWKSPRSTTGSRGTTALKDTGAISRTSSWGSIKAWMSSSFNTWSSDSGIMNSRASCTRASLPMWLSTIDLGALPGRKPGIRTRLATLLYDRLRNGSSSSASIDIVKVTSVVVTESFVTFNAFLSLNMTWPGVNRPNFQVSDRLSKHRPKHRFKRRMKRPGKRQTQRWFNGVFG